MGKGRHGGRVKSQGEVKEDRRKKRQKGGKWREGEGQIKKDLRQERGRGGEKERYIPFKQLNLLS